MLISWSGGQEPSLVYWQLAALLKYHFSNPVRSDMAGKLRCFWEICLFSVYNCGFHGVSANEYCYY